MDDTPARPDERLTTSLAWALLAAGSYEEAATRAGQALSALADPVRRAETHWVLTRAQVSAGGNDDAIATLNPPGWLGTDLA